MGGLILVVLFVVIGGILGLGFYARRGEADPDRPGERSAVTFAGGDALLADDEQDLLESQGLHVGRGPLDALLQALIAGGIHAHDAEPDEVGWGAHIGEAGAQSYLMLTLLDDDLWHMVVLDPSSGGPGRTEHLQPIADALAALPGLSDIRWIARGGDPFGEGTPGPFEGAES